MHLVARHALNRLLTMLLAASFIWMSAPAFAEEHLEPVGDDDVFFNTLILACANQYAIDHLGAPPILFSKPKIKWGAAPGFALTYMENLDDGTGGTVTQPSITIYPASFFEFFELENLMASVEAGQTSDEEAWDFLCSLIGMTAYHEILHHCYGLDEDSMEPYSCQHASIDFAAHLAGCERLDELSAMIADAEEDLEGVTDPEEQEALQQDIDRWKQQKAAICMDLKQIEAKWNGTENDSEAAEAMRACIEGLAQLPSPDPQADYPKNGCPGGYPDLPEPPAESNSGFEGDVVFAPCDACGA